MAQESQKSRLKLELIIGDGGTEMHNASLPVRWCVDQKTIDALEASGRSDPHILLVVIGKGRYGQNEKRYLVPLGDMMTYVSFYCPGANKIYGAIVAHYDGRKGLQSLLLMKTYRSYDTTVIDTDGEIRRDSNLQSYIICNTSAQEVVIPKELFADPPEWEQRWVNLRYRSQPIDECDYRRRRAFAYTIQPFLMLFLLFFEAAEATGMILIRTAYATLLLSLGFRKVNLKPILHPFDMKTSAVKAYNVGRWTVPKRGKGIERFLLLPLTPLYVLLAFCGWYIYDAVTSTSIVDERAVAINTVLYAVLNPFVIFLSICGAMRLFSPVHDKVTSWMDRWSDKRSGKKSEQRRAKNALETLRESQRYAAMQVLLCKDGPTDDLRADISALPEEKRSLRLHFYAVKAKMCRPFAV